MNTTNPKAPAAPYFSLNDNQKLALASDSELFSLTVKAEALGRGIKIPLAVERKILENARTAGYAFNPEAIVVHEIAYRNSTWGDSLEGSKLAFTTAAAAEAAAAGALVIMEDGYDTKKKVSIHPDPRICIVQRRLGPVFAGALPVKLAEIESMAGDEFDALVEECQNDLSKVCGDRARARLHWAQRLEYEHLAGNDLAIAKAFFEKAYGAGTWPDRNPDDVPAVNAAEEPDAPRADPDAGLGQ